MRMLSVEDAPMIMISGREWAGFTWDQLRVLEGRIPKDAKEPGVVLGRWPPRDSRKKWATRSNSRPRNWRW